MSGLLQKKKSFFYDFLTGIKKSTFLQFFVPSLWTSSKLGSKSRLFYYFLLQVCGLVLKVNFYLNQAKTQELWCHRCKEGLRNLTQPGHYHCPWALSLEGVARKSLYNRIFVANCREKQTWGGGHQFSYAQ